MPTQELFPEEKKLFLLDGMALTYRAHFALVRSPRFTSSGMCTSGVFGMLNAVMDLINRHKPTHMVAAFDTSEPTQRHIDYPEYKAQRDAMPEDIAEQLPYIDRLLDALNITVLRIPGYEADDIIGTLAHQAVKQHYRSWMVTPDKDYDQLVSDDVMVYKPGRKGGEAEIFGVAEVLKKWEVQRVDQVIDILGLMGDASDNIPGVPGIGPKTAQKLIEKYGSIEELYQHTDELKGKQKERVVENKDQALLSKRLVTIQLDVPHDVDFDSLKWDDYDKEKLKALLMELEFDTIGKKIFGKSFSSATSRAKVIREKRESEIQATLFDEPVKEKTIDDVPHDYHIVDTPEKRAALIKQLLKQESICFDTETTGLNPREALPLGIAFAYEPHSAYYVTCGASQAEALAVIEEFRDVFQNEKITKIGHNLQVRHLAAASGTASMFKAADRSTRCSSTFDDRARDASWPGFALSKLYLELQTDSDLRTLIGPKGRRSKEHGETFHWTQLSSICMRRRGRDAANCRAVMRSHGGHRKTRRHAKCATKSNAHSIPGVSSRWNTNGITTRHRIARRFIRKTLQTRNRRLCKNKIFAAAGHEFNVDSPETTRRRPCSKNSNSKKKPKKTVHRPVLDARSRTRTALG